IFQKHRDRIIVDAYETEDQARSTHEDRHGYSALKRTAWDLEGYQHQCAAAATEVMLLSVNFN
uniref:hypothetical protein n=1 Tax=Pedobacter sp. TaxID=1411316 RepID=UPI003D7FA637